MQATRAWTPPERVRTSSATVFAVSALYQNWLKFQFSDTRETSEPPPASEWCCCSARNSLRAARVWELRAGSSSSEGAEDSVSPVTELGFSWSWSAIALIWCGEEELEKRLVGIWIQAAILSGSGFKYSDPNRTNKNRRCYNQCNRIQVKR